MFEPARESQAIALSVRLYRALIVAYPAGFRREYGDPMVQAFRDSCRRTRSEGGRLALLALWGRATIDYIKTVVEENAYGGVHMSRDKFIRLSGWALILGSIAMIVGWLAVNRPEYDRYNAASLPIDRYANMAGLPLFTLSLLLVSLGMLGMVARFGRQAGGFGRACLGMGALFGLVSAMGVIGLEINDSSPWWEIFFFGWLMQFLALALFGLVCMQRKLLPRWNILPFLAGIWLPGIILTSIGIGWQPAEVVNVAVFLIGMAGVLALGFLLQSDHRPASIAAGGA